MSGGFWIGIPGDGLFRGWAERGPNGLNLACVRRRRRYKKATTSKSKMAEMLPTTIPMIEP